MAHVKQCVYKKFEYLDFHHGLSNQPAQPDMKDFIKIVFIKAGGHATIDLNEYYLIQDTILFINIGQHFWIDNDCSGTLLYYNRDFCCVEIHDKEVACDGILFHNANQVPVVLLDAETSIAMQNILFDIKTEIRLNDTGSEEMLRVLLKQIIIKCIRIRKLEHKQAGEQAKPEVEFSTTFSQLVEWHYTRHHTVAEYAELLHITPKALNKRITRYSNTTPNNIIKNRIIIEAKRLLLHTRLSIKEIGYQLGYEDTSYFIRMFTKHASISPQGFRLQYMQL